jgi:ribosomal protein L37E
MTCNTCGEDATEFREGHCIDCLWESQSRLDEHNARHDWWTRLSDRERRDQIRRAM